MTCERNLNVAKQKVLAIVGPTGIGKTALSIRLAHALNGEIVSCDSMQVYKKMDIGTAKVTEQEKDGIVHYLVDEQAYDIPYNVKVFQTKCRQAIKTITEKGKFPILCGGTGLYLKAALYDYDFQEEKPDTRYDTYLQTLDNDQLHELLKQKDPQSAEKIHNHNRKRMIRALQIAHQGLNKTQREAQQNHEPIYDIFFLGLSVDRDLLHERINRRVDRMFDAGLVEEVETLFSDPKTWEYTSFQGIGYKEFKAYFLKEKNLEEIRTQIKTNSRRYAKRQYTWFKNQMDVHWYEPDDPKIKEDIQAWLSACREG